MRQSEEMLPRTAMMLAMHKALVGADKAERTAAASQVLLLLKHVTAYSPKEAEQIVNVLNREGVRIFPTVEDMRRHVLIVDKANLSDWPEKYTVHDYGVHPWLHFLAPDGVTKCACGKCDPRKLVSLPPRGRTFCIQVLHHLCVSLLKDGSKVELLASRDTSCARLDSVRLLRVKQSADGRVFAPYFGMRHYWTGSTLCIRSDSKYAKEIGLIRMNRALKHIFPRVKTLVSVAEWEPVDPRASVYDPEHIDECEKKLRVAVLDYCWAVERGKTQRDKWWTTQRADCLSDGVVREALAQAMGLKTAEALNKALAQAKRDATESDASVYQAGSGGGGGGGAAADTDLRSAMDLTPAAALENEVQLTLAQAKIDAAMADSLIHR